MDVLLNIPRNANDSLSSFVKFLRQKKHVYIPLMENYDIFAVTYPFVKLACHVY